MLNSRNAVLLISLTINQLAIASLDLPPIELTVSTNISELREITDTCGIRYELQDGYILQRDGAPLIPYKVIRVGLPIGSRVTTVESSVEDTQSLGRIQDYPWFAGDSKTDGSPPPQIARNQTIYASAAPYPARFAEVITQGILGSQPLAEIAIYPVRLVPTTGELTFAPNVNLTLHLEPADGTRRLSPPPGSEVITKGVINQAQLDAPPPALLSGGLPGSSQMGIGAEYIIITSASMAPAFYPYLVWKTQKGLLSELVLIEDILAAYSGEDDAARLRAYLQQAAAAGARWVLLGGDEDIVPIRYAFPGDVNYPISLASQQVCDLYFSDLTGDWDFDHDGIYGEQTQDRPDFYPEIYVGRIPANDPAEAAEWVRKALVYEQNPGLGDASYLTKALFIVADQMRDLDEHLALAQKFPTDFLLDVSSCAEQPSGASSTPTQPTAVRVGQVMNEGWGFISNLNHGSIYAYTAMAPGYNQVPRSFFWGDTLLLYDEASSLTRLDPTSKFGIHYSISCYLAAFDFDKETLRPGPFITNHSFGESYLFLPDRGGVAFLGNTRWGWVSASYRLQCKFLEYLFSDSVSSLGQAQAFSKIAYSGFADIAYGHVLLGDPEMPVWKQQPVPLSMTVPTSVGVGTCSLTISVTSPSGPVANCRICLWKPGELYRRTTTDSDGRLEIDLSIVDAGPLYVTAIAPNMLPKVETVTVTRITDITEKADLPSVTQLIGNSPNPFNSSTVVSFTNGAPQPVLIEIFDIKGSRVAVLCDEILPPGKYVLAWDARNSTGTPVASGTYCLRLKAPFAQLTRKMLLLK